MYSPLPVSGPSPAVALLSGSVGLSRPAMRPYPYPGPSTAVAFVSGSVGLSRPAMRPAPLPVRVSGGGAFSLARRFVPACDEPRPYPARLRRSLALWLGRFIPACDEARALSGASPAVALLSGSVGLSPRAMGFAPLSGASPTVELLAVSVGLSPRAMGLAPLSRVSDGRVALSLSLFVPVCDGVLNFVRHFSDSRFPLCRRQPMFCVRRLDRAGQSNRWCLRVLPSVWKCWVQTGTRKEAGGFRGLRFAGRAG